MRAVARPINAIATNGSPATVLGYHSELNPSASASSASSIMRSTVDAAPFNPILMTVNLRNLTPMRS